MNLVYCCKCLSIFYNLGQNYISLFQDKAKSILDIKEWKFLLLNLSSITPDLSSSVTPPTPPTLLSFLSHPPICPPFFLVSVYFFPYLFFLNHFSSFFLESPVFPLYLFFSISPFSHAFFFLFSLTCFPSPSVLWFSFCFVRSEESNIKEENNKGKKESSNGNQTYDISFRYKLGFHNQAIVLC